MDEKIKEIKKLIVETAHNAKVGHLPSSFSSLEIMYTLYKRILTPENLNNPQRDMVIISKEHARLGQVCVLAYLGFLKKKYLASYMQNGGKLGHDLYNLNQNDTDAVDYACGSLGHGLSVAAGFALANKNRKIYVIVGDGELQEGSNWEALMFIIQHNIKNLVVIIDKNSMQIDDFTKNIIDTSSKVNDVFAAMGFDVVECDGHSLEDLNVAFEKEVEKPKCVIAKTIKGDGLEFLHETKRFNHFHASPLSEDEYRIAVGTLA